MLIGIELQKAGIDFLSVSARHRDGFVRLTKAIVASEADERKLREWCASGWTVPVVVEPNAIRIATAEEIAESESEW